MNIVICNDQMDYLNLIERKVRECYHDEMQMQVYSFTNSKELKKNLRRRGYQLAFVEMKTEENEGIEIAKEILKYSPSCHIVFICDQYIRLKEAFEIGTYQYMLRPIRTQELSEIIGNVVKEYKDTDVRFRLHTSSAKNCLFYTKDIIYIQTYYHTLEIITRDRVFRSDVKNRYVIRPYLIPRHFVQINQSIMINMAEIDFLTDRCVILKNREIFNISYTHATRIIAKYQEYKKKLEKKSKTKGKEKNENSNM